MIVVIADDFTGAAELGGIGLRHGLKTEICTVVPDRSEADLLVIAADTRSTDVEAAVAGMLEITRRVRELSPELVYKKTDSVLRGHVVAELKVHMEVLGFKQTLLVPANPALGRVIRDGHYFVNGVPVHETAFAKDPEFPVRSSNVQEMLGRGSSGSGIIVGEAESVDDLWDWAGRAEPGMLLAGAAGFFSAILDRRRLPVLYVSGTTFDSSREGVRRLYEDGGPVLYMPVDMNRAVELLSRGKLVVAEGGGMSALELRTRMGRVIAQLLEQVKVGELVIEGGSTAYAILKEAGLSRFVPEQELAQGVIRMRVLGGMLVTVKPGSYQWPDSLQY
ncbi:MAG TPA: four-carbon acid sugar kinase family protein [Puia sp.]|jgi:uncharacterized protein YgbK (DUF1537 family)